MTCQRPGGGPTRGGKAVDSNVSNSAYSALPHPSTLDTPTLIACRFLWWRMRRRYGVRLPPELGVIVINGGADPDWPVPRTQHPEPEAGGPGGWR